MLFFCAHFFESSFWSYADFTEILIPRKLSSDSSKPIDRNPIYKKLWLSRDFITALPNVVPGSACLGPVSDAIVGRFEPRLNNAWQPGYASLLNEGNLPKWAKFSMDASFWHFRKSEASSARREKSSKGSGMRWVQFENFLSICGNNFGINIGIWGLLVDLVLSKYEAL